MPPKLEFIPLDDGVSLAVQQWSSAGPPIMLLHGFGDHSGVWSDFAPRISRLFRVLTLDLRGHGRSAWDPTGRYGTGRHVSDLQQVLCHFTDAPWILVGHSLGAEVALRLAAAKPSLCLALVIVDFGPDIDAEARAYIRKGYKDSIRTYPSLAAYVEHLGEARPLAQPELLHRVAQEALLATPDGFLPCSDPALADPDALQPAENVWELLPRLTCASVVVRGAGSAILKVATAAQMMTGLRDGLLVTVKRAGHSVMLDNPVGFAEAVAPFLTKFILPCRSTTALTD